MTLIVDQRAQLQGQPGVHALIIGVSAYAHLPGGTGTPAPDSFGMAQLSSAALTAYRIAAWLQQRKDRLPVPLASCRVLLSPSAREETAEPQLAGLADRATRANLVAGARQWREDAAAHQDNMALFYFAGHGVQRSKNDSVLLLEDFNDPNAGGTLTNAVDTSNLFYGMAASTTRPKLAQTQVYFIDACRVLPSQFRNFERMTVPDIFDIEEGGTDERRAPIFFAAVPGALAYARKGVQTLFSEALLKCLNGAAAEAEEDPEGQVRWVVSINSLLAALESEIRQLNQITGTQQDFVLGGHTKNAQLHFLDGPPLVETLLSIDPIDALQLTSIELRDAEGTVVHRLKAPITPHPYQQAVPAGIYEVKARIKQRNHPQFGDKRQLVKAEPPGGRWKVRVLR